MVLTGERALQVAPTCAGADTGPPSSTSSAAACMHVMYLRMCVCAPQVLIGLLQLPPELSHQRLKQESSAVQDKAVREFSNMWDMYDWTRQLQ